MSRSFSGAMNRSGSPAKVPPIAVIMCKVHIGMVFANSL